MKRTVLALLLVAAVAYAVDFLSLRLQVPRRPMVGAITVHMTYAVKLKNGTTEYDDAGDRDVACANSLFPQLGYQPCWYTNRHTDQQIKIDSGNPNNPSLF